MIYLLLSLGALIPLLLWLWGRSIREAGRLEAENENAKKEAAILVNENSYVYTFSTHDDIVNRLRQLAANAAKNESNRDK